MDFVKRNDIVTVRNVMDDDPLPEMIECSISDATSNETILQVLTINRISDIDLNQQIGSLRVISCNDLSCYVGIQYNYIVSNIGRVDANVTSVDRILNKYDRLDLLDQRKVERLVANQKFSLQAKETVNTCSPKSYSTKLIVKANEEESSSSAYCIASDTFSFEIIPDCDIKLNLRCKLSNSKNDNDCKNINTEKQLKCICSRNCTDSLLFQYTASQCEVRNNSSALYCMDSNGGPIPIAQLIVEDSDGSIMYKGMVSSEMIVEVRAASTVKPNKSCLGGSDLRVSVRHPSTGKILQQVLFHPTCSSADIDNDKNIRLLEAFGALNLIGYNCKNGVDTQIEEHKCLVNVEYDMEVQNTGISSLKVVDLSVSIDGDEASILKRTNRSSVLLDPTTSKTFTIPSVINRCSTIISATASSEVVGRTVGSQVLCQSDDNLSFQMTVSTTNSNY
jgi:hypothetical protein